jgi:hypothetical protein
MLRDDRSYFIRRAAEERAAAKGAQCPQAAEAHRVMAERYAAWVAELAAQPEALSA